MKLKSFDKETKRNVIRKMKNNGTKKKICEVIKTKF